MNKLTALGCIEVTSQTQADNGNICYHDPIANCDYIIYENGYVRRSHPRTRRYNGRLDTTHAIYQLNPTRSEKYVSEWSGNVFDTKIRIMLPTHEERMECASRGVANYRKTLIRRKEEAKVRSKVKEVVDFVESLGYDDYNTYKNISKTLLTLETIVK